MAAPGGVGLMAARSVPVQPGRAARPGVSARPVALAMTTEGEGAESIDGPSVAQPNRLRLDLQRARSALIEAELAVRPADRFLGAQLGALRVAAVVLSARSVRRPVGSGPRNVWELVADVAPEYTEWAAFFAGNQLKQQVVRAGAKALVSAREADDLIRDAQRFHDEIARRLDAWEAKAVQAG